MEAAISTSRLLFSTNVKTKPLLTGFIEYGMIEETGLPDVISRLADHLPVSIASEEVDQEEAWRMMMERDRYNMIYGRGKYAPEPEPEIVEVELGIEDETHTSTGLEICIPGLEF
jgi:hypothetical protein